MHKNMKIYVYMIIFLVIILNILITFKLKPHRFKQFLNNRYNKLTLNKLKLNFQKFESNHRSKSVIDMAFYINLEHRNDRRQSIEKQLQAIKFNFEQIKAINPRDDEYKHLIQNCFDDRACPGQVGCQFSHLLALNTSLKRSYKIVAIFEDDFIFQSFVNLEYVENIVSETMKHVPDWDVIALSLNIYEETPLRKFVNFSESFQAELTQITNAQTTGGYILRDTIIPHVYNSFLNCDVKKDYHTAIDQCWKYLQYQSAYKWIGFEPQPGTQLKSFSDIERQEVDYGLTR